MRTRPLAQHSVARRLLRRTPSISLCPNQRAKRMQESGDSSGQLRHPCNSIRAHWDLPEWPDKHKRAARSELRTCYPTGIRPGPTQADQDNPRSALSRHPTVSLRSGEQHHRWTPPARNPRRFSHFASRGLAIAKHDSMGFFAFKQETNLAPSPPSGATQRCSSSGTVFWAHVIRRSTSPIAGTTRRVQVSRPSEPEGSARHFIN
jgi:hypothetical protein